MSPKTLRLKPDFTLILPCYNEAEHITESIEEIVKTLANSKYSYKIILIDDKSTDNTRKLINKILNKYKNIEAYFHSRNQGRGATVKDGILKAKTDIVGFIDFDLEVSPVYIPKMVSMIKNGETEIATGCRYYVFNPLNFDDLLREITSRLYRIITKKYLGIPFNDPETGYKFFNRIKILPVLKETKNKHWFWDTEIIARSYFSKLQIKEIPVLFLRRWDKTSTVKLIPDSIRQLKEIIKFKKSLSEEDTLKYKETSFKEILNVIVSSPQYCWDKEYRIWAAKVAPARGKRVTQILLDYFSKDEKILDVGSSRGLTLGYLAQRFPNIIGVDIDKNAIEIGNKHLKKLGINNRIIWYNGNRLPFKNNSLDGIVTSETFEHVDNQGNFVKELARVLKKNAKLIITSPNKLYPIECEFHLPFLSYLPKKLADTYVKLSGKGKSYDNINHPTYEKFSLIIGKYFEFEDITFKIVKNYKKYHLQEERGSIAIAISTLIRLVEIILIKPFSKIVLGILTHLSPGWVFVCAKK